MAQQNSANGRREFLKHGSLAAVALSTGTVIGKDNAPTSSVSPDRNQAGPQLTVPQSVEHKHPHVQAEYDGFSRYVPSRGHDPDSDYYIGKLVPGFRRVEDGPAPFVAPDLDKLPYELKGGVKEFHLVPQSVEREFLPGYKMNVWGFNGSMPGPTIEVTQGDRVRIVVTNELPEDTSVHWHGFELPVQYDGAHTLTQNPIKPGKTFVYEFNVHEEGTFFYHTHVAMQETHGMVGWFIVHPKKVFDPPVDRDFGLIFQNFAIMPNQTVNDSWSMEWNWHTINGRSGPFTTPLVVKHGERVRVRIMNFAPIQHHPIHLHGHTFWLTGHEGARIPKSAWIPRNVELIAIAQSSSFEFIANNPGDWMFHCHMTHHMMNHMVKHVGPRIRQHAHVDAYLANLNERPAVSMTHSDPGFAVPGYPQGMKGMEMSEDFMQAIWSRREFMGMRATAPMSLKGLMTALRVVPDDLYHRLMETDEKIEKGAIFQEIVNRFGTPDDYQPAPMPMMHGM
ncbi:MAG: copper oxidase [Planctomycetaceae bacterium]|nr:copper oxidase [Planctomycetaceae bacterium]